MRVLIVEDDAAIALVEQKALERDGYEVTVAATGGQRPLPLHAFEPPDDLVEEDDGAALLRPLEFPDRPRELVLDRLQLTLHRLRDRRRLGARVAREGEERCPRQR